MLLLTMMAGFLSAAQGTFSIVAPGGTPGFFGIIRKITTDKLARTDVQGAAISIISNKGEILLIGKILDDEGMNELLNENIPTLTKAMISIVTSSGYGFQALLSKQVNRIIMPEEIRNAKITIVDSNGKNLINGMLWSDTKMRQLLPGRATSAITAAASKASSSSLPASGSSNATASTFGLNNTPSAISEYRQNMPINVSKVLIIGNSDCGYCRDAKSVALQMSTKFNIPFEFHIDRTMDPTAWNTITRWKASAGGSYYTGIPIIFIYDEIKKTLYWIPGSNIFKGIYWNLDMSRSPQQQYLQYVPQSLRDTTSSVVNRARRQFR